MIARLRRIEATQKTNKGKTVSQVLVDDGPDTDLRLVKVFSDDPLTAKENDLIVINQSDDGKLHFFRKIYGEAQKPAPRAVNS